MSKDVVLDPTQQFLLKCGKCANVNFKVIVDASGATCICHSCDSKYKIESLGGGVRVGNA